MLAAIQTAPDIAGELTAPGAESQFADALSALLDIGKSAEAVSKDAELLQSTPAENTSDDQDQSDDTSAIDRSSLIAIAVPVPVALAVPVQIAASSLHSDGAPNPTCNSQEAAQPSTGSGNTAMNSKPQSFPAMIETVRIGASADRGPSPCIDDKPKATASALTTALPVPTRDDLGENDSGHENSSDDLSLGTVLEAETRGQGTTPPEANLRIVRQAVTVVPGLPTLAPNSDRADAVISRTAKSDEPETPLKDTNAPQISGANTQPQAASPHFSVQALGMVKEDATPVLNHYFSGPPRVPGHGAMPDNAPDAQHPHATKQDRGDATSTETPAQVSSPKSPDATSVLPTNTPAAEQQADLASHVSPTPISTDLLRANHPLNSAPDAPSSQPFPSQLRDAAPAGFAVRSEPGAVHLVSRLEHQELRFGWNSQEFGRIEVRTTLDHDRVAASISVPDAQLRSSLRDQLGSLDHALAGHSLELAQFSTFDNSAPQDNRREDPSPSSDQAPKARKEQVVAFSSSRTVIRAHSGMLDLRA